MSTMIPVSNIPSPTPKPRFTTGVPPADLHDGSPARPDAELRLVRKVYTRCAVSIQEACRMSSVRPDFLGALTANESGGNPAAVRFELSVYRHLEAVAVGESPRYGGICDRMLYEELAQDLHPKTGEFHARFLASLFLPGKTSELDRLADEDLRELACSWGFTQIMGYHVIGRRGTVHDLIEPRFHYRLANQLLAQFAESFQLDLGREFEELFRCWNTGRPDGKTWDRNYVDKGLRRMAIYRELMAADTAGYAGGKIKVGL